jgi:integrase
MSAPINVIIKDSTTLVANGSEQENSGVNSKSGGFLAESASSRKSIGKADARYWLQDGKLDTTPKSRFYSCRIQTQGRREPFPLRTANKKTAAAKAAEIFGDITALGWEAALTKHKPTFEKPTEVTTVGEFINAVEAVADVRPATMAGNARAFRRIVADVMGLKATPSRYASRGEGRTDWLSEVHAVPLDAITPDKVQAWKLSLVAKAGRDEGQARASRNSANTIIRMARSLFAKRVLRFVKDKLVLPSPLPFEGVELYARQTMRYAGGVDVGDLLTRARNDLGGDPKRVEEWKALLLCLFAGLRRNEADKLRWNSIDFATGQIRIEVQDDFQPKAESSLGEVPIDEELISALRGLRAREPKSVYVLRGEGDKQRARWNGSRAETTFKSLAAWLRANGVNTRTPLHTLRKEAGSLVCQKAGLFAASRFLRHADVSITAQHYVVQKERITVGLGSLLTSPAQGKVVKFNPTQSPSHEAQEAKAGRVSIRKTKRI